MNLFGISLILAPYFYSHPFKKSKNYLFLPPNHKKTHIFLLRTKTFTTFADAFKPRWRNR